jgi:Domain of unknown function (DUF4157)
MRMPWQRRGAGRAEPTEVSAPDVSPRAWRSLPPLAGSVGARPPLTAQSAELADALSRRLRSTRERPPLVHRAGLPDPAAAGTVRGIATAVPQTGRPSAGSRASDSWGQENDEVVPETIPVVGSDTPATARVTARRRSSGSLTAVDSALAALLHPAPQSQPEIREEEVELESDVDTGATPAPAGPPNGLQHTVIRRRAGGGAARPLGLQAPITQEGETRDATASPVSDMPRQASHREPAPRAVAAAVGRLHRADVTDVRIERGEEAQRLSSAANARAVTRGGEVFIPASEGPLDSGRGGGLLAHELTHVIQQRRLGNSVPLEHSPGGRRLEAEASMTERHVRGDLAAPAPAPTASEPPAPQAQAPSTREDDEAAAATVRDIQDDLVASGRAFRMPDGSLVFPGSGAHLREQRSSPAQPAVVLQRAPDDPAPADAAEPGSSEQFVFRTSPDPGAAPNPELPLQQASAPAVASAPATQFVPRTETAAAAPGAAPNPAAPAAESVPIVHEAAPIDLDDLARRVYGQVRTQLRSELLIDRERAGLLTDFR